MDLSSIPPSPMKGIVNIVVEIPAGSRNKYEYCSEAGIMALDRVLHSSVRYPFDYGFIPNTLAEDGAPLDAMVIMDEPTFAGCLIKARPIGVLDMHDCGAYDGKLLCVPMANPRQANIVSINQIAPNQLEDVAEFFRTSKGLDGRTVQIDGWRDFNVVENLLKSCIPLKKKKFKILVKTDKLPKLKKEEFHLLELIDLEVKTLENNELKIIGKVINLENEKNNLLVIELFKNQKTVLIPFVKEIVPLVDIKNNFLIINPPNGLLEL